MKIAILGWGSLIWDPCDLPHYGPWCNEGPELKLEFSRISKDCRLTLVIDEIHGEWCKTYYALSPRNDLCDAIEDLRKREGTSEKNIGYLNYVTKVSSFEKNQDQVNISEILYNWNKNHDFEGVVWTALPSNFTLELEKKFSTENVIKYLFGLPNSCRKNALKYIHNAPEEIITPVRREITKILVKKKDVN